MNIKYFILLITVSLLSTHNANAVDRLPFTSSFENGTFSEWNGGRDETLTVVSEDASAGSFSAKAVMSYGVTADNYKDFYFGNHPTINGAGAENALWLEFDSKFDSNFDFGSENIHKIAILNFEDENGRRRYQIIVNVIVSTETYFIENLSWNADRSFDKTVNAYQQNLNTPTTMSRGEWDKLKLYIRLNTPGTHDGVLRFWVNDQKIMEYTDTYYRENTSYLPNKLILSNYTRDTDISGVQRWDNFYLDENEPVNLIKPNPPVLLD